MTTTMTPITQSTEMALSGLSLWSGYQKGSEKLKSGCTTK